MSDANTAVVDQTTGQANSQATGQEQTLPAWMAQLPDDLKQNENLAQFKSLGELGKKFLDVKDGIKIPGENATDEERAAFFEKTGRPKTPDDYELETPKIPKGMTINEELSKNFRKIAHDIGLNKAQTSKLFDFYNDHMINTYKSTLESRAQAKKEAAENLKKEWGKSYDENMKIVNRAYNEFGSEELTKYLDESGEGNNPILIKAFLNIGKTMLDDNFVEGKLGQDKKTRKGVFTYPNSPELNDKQ